MTGPEPETADDAPRHAVRLPGRMVLAGEAEQPCVLHSVRDREATFRTEAPCVEGRRGAAVAYLDLVGRLEGPAVRVDREHVVMTISAPEAKWARLRQQFAMLAGMEDADRRELRSQGRVVPDARDVDILLQHGITSVGRLRDLSRSGAAVDADAGVQIGDPVVLGSTKGRVSRLFQGGFAVQFVRLLPLERFGADYRL